MQQEYSRIPPESILFVSKWNGSDAAQADYMIQSDQVLICLPPNTDSFFYHNHLLTYFFQIAKDF